MLMCVAVFVFLQIKEPFLFKKFIVIVQNVHICMQIVKYTILNWAYVYSFLYLCTSKNRKGVTGTFS